MSGDWIRVRRDAETGIEAVRAHFEGHAYDPHDHDEVLLGVTEQGVQQFRCRGRVQRSTPGRAILIEPGETHDGESPEHAGFTYAMLYLPAARLQAELDALGGGTIGFRDTLREDPGLAGGIHRAFRAVFAQEGRLARDLALGELAARLAALPPPAPGRAAAAAVRRACDLIRAEYDRDLGLADLSAAAGTGRFALARAFRRELGVSPHGYLVQTRLKAARKALAAGVAPAAAAAEAGFVDQSHLGRWFRRAYRLTPAAYARACTSVPD
ncbi:AraC family transcriptional regulator [Phenylobacterium sp.]|uniref:AraC family transcriptional regulator n=1 Tax=Phenylobacterium sp. TaxID=1871053 RepID=UPI0035B0B04C